MGWPFVGGGGGGGARDARRAVPHHLEGEYGENVNQSLVGARRGGGGDEDGDDRDDHDEDEKMPWGTSLRWLHLFSPLPP